LDIYENENTIVPVLRVAFLWKMDKAYESLMLFRKVLEENRDKAMELFDIFPELKNYKEFIELSDNN